jgi:hypothetical protein
MFIEAVGVIAAEFLFGMTAVCLLRKSYLIRRCHSFAAWFGVLFRNRDSAVNEILSRRMRV